MELLFAILFPYVLLWSISIYWLFSWRKFWQFLTINSVITILYLVFWIYSKLEFLVMVNMDSEVVS